MSDFVDKAVAWDGAQASFAKGRVAGIEAAAAHHDRQAARYGNLGKRWKKKQGWHECLAAEIRALEANPARPANAMPIETAPNGPQMLAFEPMYGWLIVIRYADGWQQKSSGNFWMDVPPSVQFTHWLPYPGSLTRWQATAVWRPIAEADKSIATVQTFPDVGITLRNSYPIWARDEDGRTYEAAWTDHRDGYWWDLEAESPVDPVEFMPHPLDPHFAGTVTEGSL